MTTKTFFYAHEFDVQGTKDHFICLVIPNGMYMSQQPLAGMRDQTILKLSQLHATQYKSKTLMKKLKTVFCVE